MPSNRGPQVKPFEDGACGKCLLDSWAGPCKVLGFTLALSSQCLGVTFPNLSPSLMTELRLGSFLSRSCWHSAWFLRRASPCICLLVSFEPSFSLHRTESDLLGTPQYVSLPKSFFLSQPSARLYTMQNGPKKISKRALLSLKLLRVSFWVHLLCHLRRLYSLLHFLLR